MFCDLSIIIVNYNVRFFLQYCLLTVLKASQNINAEIIVVDNASSDDDYTWMAQSFPQVHFLRNTKNVGFGQANNQGIARARGDFVLFLNPDTLLAESSLEECLHFFKSHPDCGSIGVHMMDGKGCFLPESKRSLPSTFISFCKLSGLERLFPTSKIFGKYALGYLDKNEVHEVPILAGAFLMTRRNLLEKVGGFDPIFFMYGEDIDLSFRLQNETGFRNYFLGNIQILHFKGESSKQDPQKHNKLFYEAMHLFAQKYESPIKAAFIGKIVQLGTKTLSKIASTKAEKQSISNISKNNLSSYFLLGDNASIRVLKQKISANFPDAIAVDNIENAKIVILCIGNHYSFEDSFQVFSKYSENVDFFWFEPSTNAIIGSNNKNETGIVWDLESH